MPTWLKRALKWDDETFLPPVFRLFLFVYFEIAAIPLVLLRPGWVHAMGHVGIVLSMAAGSILIWEAGIEHSGVDRLLTAAQFSGQTSSLTKPDLLALVGYGLFLVVCATPAYFLAYKSYVSSQNGWQFYGQNVNISILLVAVFLIVLAVMKAERKFSFKRAVALAQTNKAGKIRLIRSFLRRIGFSLLIAGGLLQIPANLWP